MVPRIKMEEQRRMVPGKLFFNETTELNRGTK
jgi:hypothetical protein